MNPTGGRMALLGPGWRIWRGTWTSDRALVGRGGSWMLYEDHEEVRRWSTLDLALAELWSSRTVVAGTEAWAAGWIGFGACAALAGGLPARPEDSEDTSGVLLLQPQRSVDTMASSVFDPDRHDRLRSAVRSSLDGDQFRRAVDRVRHAIAAGRVYQVNVCRQFECAWDGGVRGLLDVLQGTPPDYLSWMEWQGPGSGELVCASMESLLRIRGRRASTGPIKGSRPRGATPAEDAALVLELEGDPKERAELAMIVDLERNDLGRVAVPGSVLVVDAGRVRTFARIHHRVAEVEAILRADVSWMEVLAAVVPGGSVTGCPKRAAMETIRALEPVARGPFTGALGVIAGSGDVEMALPIRTAWTAGNRLRMGAGCGVVWDSDSHAEELESRLKIAAWLEYLGDRR